MSATPTLARKICPHCEHEGPVGRDFGWRNNGGYVIPQSWCRKCRSEKRPAGEPQVHP